MPIPKKGGAIDTATLVTRNVKLITYEVTYLPNGEDTVKRARESMPYNDQIARRELKRLYKGKGFITAIVEVERIEEPYGMEILDFIKYAKPLKNLKTTEEESK